MLRPGRKPHWPSSSFDSTISRHFLSRQLAYTFPGKLKLHAPARDRNIIFGDAENAVAYIRPFACDTPRRFCSVLQNGIDHDCSCNAAAMIDEDAVFAVGLYLEAKKAGV